MALALQQTHNPLAYYHRRYDVDCPTLAMNMLLDERISLLVKKIILPSLPILSCHPAFVRPIQLAMGLVRTTTFAYGIHLLHSNPLSNQSATRYRQLVYFFRSAVMATLTVALTYFNPAAGALLSAVHDVWISAREVKGHLFAGCYPQVMRTSINLSRDLTYLGFIYAGSIEFCIASLAMQILSGLYQVFCGDACGNFYEKLANAGMILLRVKQFNHALQTSRFRDIFAIKNS